MSDPSLETVKLAMQWLRQQETDLEAREDVLARRLGVDPDRDILVVPARIVRGYTRWPRWVAVLNSAEEPYIKVGVRDINSFKKGETGK